MAERKRRASTSSVETVDESQTRWLQETSVVRSQSSDSDIDLWPIFELQDAVVYDRQGLAFDNPLFVKTRGPFTIRGRLVITPSDRVHLVARVRSSTPIEIRNCTRYSIGLAGEEFHLPCIWVAGRGGWYEITPSKSFLPIHLKMCEATVMYYSIFDSSKELQEQHRKSSRYSRDKLNSVLLQYAAMVGDGSTLDEVVERCREFAPFFICQFNEEPESNIVWRETDFYIWFMHEFADVAKEIDKLAKDPNIEYRPPPAPTAPIKDRSSRRTTRSASLEGDPRGTPMQIPERPKSIPRQVAPDPRAEAETIHAPPKPTPQASMAADDSYESALASVVAFLMKLYDERADSKKGVVAKTAMNEIYFGNKFPTFKDGTVACHLRPVHELLHYHARALLGRLDHEAWKRHELYHVIQHLAEQPFTFVAWKLSDFPLRLIPRTPAQKFAQRRRRDAETASGPSRPNPAMDDDRDSEIARPMGKSIKQPGRRGRKSGLRTVSSKKRDYADMDSGDEDSHGSAHKRSHYFSDGAPDGDLDMEFAEYATGTPDGQRENTETDDDDDDDDDEDVAEAVDEPVPVVIRVEKIPSTTPRGPDGAWTCDQDGCGHVVRGGDEDECQARIRQHFEEHEKQASRLTLAVTESTRGHVPVNHLLEKLKKMSETANGLGPGRTKRSAFGGYPGDEGPQPIRRKLIV